MQKTNQILKEILKKIGPSKEELTIIQSLVDKFLENLDQRIKELGIDAEIFIGGSFAKKTLIKKESYDIDVFLRFDKKYEDSKISKLTAEILDNLGDISAVHGSRDYFRIKLGPGVYLELVPVRRVKSAKEAKNITDLSYSHVKYVNKKIKDSKIIEEIMLAKAFTHACNAYGAESYVNGFSGYSLEILMIHYKSFLRFVKSLSKVKEKLVIDLEKHYKNKAEIIMDLNSSKLESPIILIDPTYKQRNALAALSRETFKKFQDYCLDFLKNPSIRFFEKKEIDLLKLREKEKKRKNEVIIFDTFTNKQKGDIAGSKLLKFFNHLTQEISKNFNIKNKFFVYDETNNARNFFSVKRKKEIIFAGPLIDDFTNLKNFKKKHKDTFVKKNKIYAREKVKEKLDSFIAHWIVKNKKKINEMYINEIKIID